MTEKIKSRFGELCVLIETVAVGTSTTSDGRWKRAARNTKT
jgi:hypothetical protein